MMMRNFGKGILGQFVVIIFFVMLVPSVCAQDCDWSDPQLVERARKIIEDSPLIDGHNDHPSVLLSKYKGRIKGLDLEKVQPELPADIPRLRRGNVGAQFWAAHPRMGDERHHGAVRRTLRSIDVIRRMVARHQAFEIASTADDIERIFERDKVASLIGVEGGKAIDGSLSALRMFYELGARYLTLTHAETTSWADAATDIARHGGLTEFGEDVVREMNRLGMFVDLSHASVETAKDALRVSRAPVLFSHSNTRAVNAHPRNVPNNLLSTLADNEGVIMVNFIAGYVPPTSRVWQEKCGNSAEIDCLRAKRGIHAPEWKMRRDSVSEQLHNRFNDKEEIAQRVNEWVEQNPWPRGSVTDVADHIDHIRNVAGIDNIGIGADFYDAGGSSMAAGLDDITKYAHLFAELSCRGYSEKDLRKIAGGNLIRAMREMERVAEKMQTEKSPINAEMNHWSQ